MHRLFFYFLLILNLSITSNYINAHEKLDFNNNLEIKFNFNDNSTLKQLDNLIDKPFFLQEISFESDVSFDADEFDYLVDLKTRQFINTNDIKNALFYLKLKNRFDSVIIIFKNGNLGKKLHFKLFNFNKLNKVNIHGISFSKHSYLQRYILQPGDFFETQKHQYSIDKIKEMVYLQGYLNAQINSEINKDINKSITVDLNIDKGNVFLIDKVNFIFKDFENKECSDIEYKIKKAYLKKFLKNNYVRKTIIKNLKKLKEYLFFLNYPFAKVKMSELIDYANCKVQLNFYINLKKKLKFDFSGNNFFSNDQLSKLILSLHYPIFDLPLEILNQEIINLYKKNGFYQVQIQTTKKDFIFYFKVIEGNKLKNEPIVEKKPDLIEELPDPVCEDIFGKIVFQGNSILPFKPLINEMDLKQGEPWQRKSLKKTYFKLNQLNVFESINFNLANENDYKLYKPVIIKLFCDDDFDLRIRAGLQQFCIDLQYWNLWTYKFGATCLVKNYFLPGDNLIFDSDFTLFYQKFNLTYKTPWFFSLPINSLFQVYYNNFYLPLFYRGFKENLYKQNQQGISSTLSSRGNKIFNYSINYGFERSEISRLSLEGARALEFSDSLVNKFLPYFFLEPNIIFEKIDNELNPTRGFSLALNFKFMNSFNYHNSFLKIFLDQSVYLPVFNLNVLAFRLRFGQIFIKDFKLLLPSERFYLGGPFSIRSYEPDYCPPLGNLPGSKHGCIKCNKNFNKSVLIPQGGTTMINMNTELRMPINYVRNLSFVLFNDLGVLYNSFSKDDNKLLIALGFGVRYQTPIGPFRFDLGFRNRNYINDSFMAWYLTLGHAF